MIFVAKSRHVQWMSSQNWYSKILASVFSVQPVMLCYRRWVLHEHDLLYSRCSFYEQETLFALPTSFVAKSKHVHWMISKNIYWHSSASVFTVYWFLWCDSPVRRRVSAMTSCEVFLLQGHMLTTLFMEYKRSLEVDAALDGARCIACDRTENHFSTDAGQTVYERTGVCETCRDILQNPLSTDKQKRTQCVCPWQMLVVN